jgi:hypothetical protein
MMFCNDFISLISHGVCQSMVMNAPNDQRLSRRPTEGRPAGSKRRLGRQLPSPKNAPGYPARSPTSPPLACLPGTGWKTPQPSIAGCRRGLRRGLLRSPPACGLPAAWGIPQAPTSRRPAVPAACSTARSSTGPRLLLGPFSEERGALPDGQPPHRRALPATPTGQPATGFLSRPRPGNRALCPNAPRAPF